MKRTLAVLAILVAAALALKATAAETKAAGHMHSHAAAAQKEVTLKGEIVDSGCYIAGGKKGADHKECADKCISSGMPMGLLTADNKFYLLTPNHKDGDPYNKCKDMAASMVEVTGMKYTRNGVSMIDVTAVKAAAAE